MPEEGCHAELNPGSSETDELRGDAVAESGSGVLAMAPGSNAHFVKMRALRGDYCAMSQPAASSQRPAASSQQPAASNQQPAANRF